jgi:hypothetical protein
MVPHGQDFLGFVSYEDSKGMWFSSANATCITGQAKRNLTDKNQHVPEGVQFGGCTIWQLCYDGGMHNGRRKGGSKGQPV